MNQQYRFHLPLYCQHLELIDDPSPTPTIHWHGRSRTSLTLNWIPLKSKMPNWCWPTEVIPTGSLIEELASETALPLPTDSSSSNRQLSKHSIPQWDPEGRMTNERRSDVPTLPVRMTSDPRTSLMDLHLTPHSGGAVSSPVQWKLISTVETTRRGRSVTTCQHPPLLLHLLYLQPRTMQITTSNPRRMSSMKPCSDPAPRKHRHHSHLHKRLLLFQHHSRFRVEPPRSVTPHSFHSSHPPPRTTWTHRSSVSLST